MGYKRHALDPKHKEVESKKTEKRGAMQTVTNNKLDHIQVIKQASINFKRLK